MSDEHVSTAGLVAYEQRAAEARGHITPSNEQLIRTERGETGYGIVTAEETSACEATPAASNECANDGRSSSWKLGVRGFPKSEPPGGTRDGAPICIGTAR
jgi:hypothetical protein